MSHHPPIPRRHPPPPPPAHQYPPPRLLPASTFTYIASWRGQLLICTFVLLLGSIYYFIVQGPLASWSRARQEKRSAAASKALVEAESSSKGAEKEKDRLSVPTEGKKEKAQNRKVSNADIKKRKGSVLKVPLPSTDSAAGGSPSSERRLSTSKSNSRAPSASPAPRQERTLAPAQASRRASRASSNAAEARPDPAPQPIIRLREPTEDVTTQEKIIHTPSTPSSSAPPNAPRIDPSTPPYLIPLPSSPVAGPSRLAPIDSDYSPAGSADGSVIDDGEEEDEDDSVALPNGNHTRGYTKSPGFSIIPDAAYLPTPTPGSNKKRRKKGRGSSTALSSLGISPLSPDSTDSKPLKDAAQRNGEDAHKVNGETPAARTSRHARQASLGRPPDMSLEDLLDLRERTIDNLRAEIGIAKAEEGKAREEAAQMKAGQDRMQEQIKHMRRSPIREGDSHAQRREADLTMRLQHTTIAYEHAAARLLQLEAYLRDANIPVPALSPMPGMTHLRLHPSALSTSPLSPYHASHFPSPIAHGSPMPSPMYPSPHHYHPDMSPQMLHPGFQMPYRSASAGQVPLVQLEGDAVSFAGPLTPGLSHLGVPSPLSPYTAERGRPGCRSISTPSESERMDEPRRKSIALEVLKKKADHPGAESSAPPTESGESEEKTTGSSPSLSASAKDLGSSMSDAESQSAIQGLGVGDIEKSGGGTFTGPAHDAEVLVEEDEEEEAEEVEQFRMGRPSVGSISTAGSSHPTSPSPRRTLLCTPANADLYRMMENISPTPLPLQISRPPSRGEINGGTIRGIKVVSDGEGGAVYFREDDETSSEGRDGREREETAKLPLSASAVHGDTNLNGTPYESHLSLRGPSPAINGERFEALNGTTPGQESEEDEEEVGEEGGEYEYEPPVFASLAHTDAQRAEMDRAREAAKRGRKSRSVSAGPAGQKDN